MTSPPMVKVKANLGQAMKALYGSGQLTGIPWLLYPPEKSRYLFYKRLAGPQGQSICNGLFLQR
jgi:hypothetical protein